MKVSIAMATYNGGEYLQGQLDSFLAQTRRPDELVVCDDGSTDGTMDTLERFAELADFDVKIVRNSQNLGFVRNFEKCMRICTGDVIFLSDQDDVWFENKVGTVEGEFVAHPDVVVIAHDARLVDENLQCYGATMRSQSLAGFGSDDSVVSGAVTALRRRFLGHALPIPDGVIGHDVWLHELARLLKARLVLVDQLQLTRRHSSNTSKWVASSTKKINRFSVWSAHLRTCVAADYSDRHSLNSALQSAIDSIREAGDFPPAVLVDASSLLEIERAAIGERDRLVQAGWMARRFRAVRMLACGKYRHFNGLASFLRDFLR